MARVFKCPHCGAECSARAEGTGADMRLVIELVAAPAPAKVNPKTEDDIFAEMLGGDDGNDGEE